MSAGFLRLARRRALPVGAAMLLVLWLALSVRAMAQPADSTEKTPRGGVGQPVSQAVGQHAVAAPDSAGQGVVAGAAVPVTGQPVPAQSAPVQSALAQPAVVPPMRATAGAATASGAVPPGATALAAAAPGAALVAGASGANATGAASSGASTPGTGVGNGPSGAVASAATSPGAVTNAASASVPGVAPSATAPSSAGAPPTATVGAASSGAAVVAAAMRSSAAMPAGTVLAATMPAPGLLPGLPSAAQADAGQPVAANGSSTATVDAADAFDNRMTEAVIETALGFLTPRTLEPHTAREFSLWGLGGMGALDTSLSVATNGAEIRLLAGQGVLLSRPIPASDDLKAWAELDTAFLASAWNNSSAIRAGGHDAILQSFFDELFNHLDPYSRYVAPAPASSDRAERSGGDAELGLSLGVVATHNTRATVITAVNANGPGWPGGVDVGEYLLSVDGHPTAGHDPATVAEWLRGAADSSVTLRLASSPFSRGRNLVLKRSRVPPETVFAFTSGRIVVLRITSFSTETAEEMSQYLDQATQDARLGGLILDLRGNRGGVLQQAVTAAALLLDRGVAVVTKGRDAQANHVWAVQGGDMLKGLPIAILVDGRTASAAEILAAALSDHHRAVVIGSATLGKGLVQMVAQLPDEGELFVTWSRVIAPLGWPLQGLGVMPQLCTSKGEAEASQQLSAYASGSHAGYDGIAESRAVRFPVPVSRILEIRKACPAALGGDLDYDIARSMLENRTAYRAAVAAIPDEAALAPGDE